MSCLTRRHALGTAGALALLATAGAAVAAPRFRMQSWPLKAPERTGIHDVAPAPDGGVWFTAQASGHLGWFDPKSGRTELIPLAQRSSPHGVIQGPDKAAWITDGAQNAIVRVGWPDRKVMAFPLPAGLPHVNLNTAAFDRDGDLWFTGQLGYVGKLTVKTGQVRAGVVPRGRGPYGICATPAGEIWWCSLAGSYIARIDRRTGESVMVEPPTREQGARRIWSDSQGRLWVAEWNSGQLSMHDPQARSWKAWKLPGQSPQPYAVYVDERDLVWVSDFGGNAVFAFDPRTEKFERFAMPRANANVRQILGRPGEVWLPESGTEHITVIRTA
ncbi:lyase [Ramlibacter sp. RBP-2]|uniref:Virginiamycin B lyase n=1 Tax=Ramlibacter lithotrophicus TaxID=2606681 RepID=A0A7X6DDQ8_9BURK|nr:lyase [Ramlibacter lithotrophicus]NKE65163.1 lyase [Ramlibacter lithotrophicus]